MQNLRRESRGKLWQSTFVAGVGRYPALFRRTESCVARFPSAGYTMPEYVILLSAIACAGAGVALYYNRNSVPALAVVIIGAVVFLYGVGQYFDRDNTDARALGFSDATDRRAAQDAGIN